MYPKKFSSSSLYSILYFIFSFAFSFFILQYYTEGDQRFYTPFYEYCLQESNSLSWKFECYKDMVGAKEPVYFIISYMFSFFSSKIFFTSFTNALLFFFMVKVIFKYYNNIWHRQVFVIFLLSNYYTLGLFFSTERLKVGFIFFFIALYLDSNKKIVSFLIALFSHLQMVFIIMPLLISFILESGVKLKTKIFLVASSIISTVLLFLLLGSQIFSKFEAYHEGASESDLGLLGVIKTSVFVILASITVKKIEPLIAGMPIVIMSYFIGSTRLGMMAFILYLCYAINYNKRMTIPMIMVLSYFSYKSIGFISNIFNYGEGWIPY